jgi:hypothetical protein
VRESLVEGAKLIDNRQDWPAESAPATEEPALTSGHEDGPPLYNLKFDDMLGFVPFIRIGKFNVTLPTFSIVTVFGLSMLVEPGEVDSKVKLGGSAKSSFNTRLL